MYTIGYFRERWLPLRPASPPVVKRLAIAAGCRELGKLAGTGRVRLGLDGAIVVHQAVAERRELGAAAGGTAMLGLDHRLAEQAVECVDQQPGTAIRHPHGAPGRRNRAVIADGFEQPDFAVADGLAGGEIKTQGEPRHAANLTNARGRRTGLHIESPYRNGVSAVGRGVRPVVDGGAGRPGPGRGAGAADTRG